MTPPAFVSKWSQIQLKETAAAQSHFNDICALVGHPTPTVADPKGAFFTFEASTDKTSGGRGRADVWYKGRFIWEYKGAHADLDKAYQQLLLYRESLENPPLLITSDLQRIIIHTNFTGTVKQVHEIDFDRLLNGDGLALLRRVFYEPDSFKPTQTQERATQATAETFVQVVKTLQEWSRTRSDAVPPERIAHFVIRLFFCLFAEDLDLLPNKVFTQLVQRQGGHYYRFVESLRALFTAMRDGGPFGPDYIPHFDGGLFDDAFVPELPSDIVDHLLRSARQDWSAIDPTIFGTLFERVIDEDKRAQLGAHYTSKDDILLIVEPVLMKPLRDEWRELRSWANQQLKQPDNHQAVSERLAAFAHRLAAVRVLDPACGSANFLYVSLRLLLDLQKEVITFAAAHGLETIPLTVSPAQLYGIEINPYAHELAQITVWIGYLQWRKENGFADFTEPILRPLYNIQHKDAILAYDEQGNPVESTWPEVDVIVGNPPFLGDKKMRSELGDDYVHKLRKLYSNRIPGQSDLVCYWFEKARAMLESNRLRRAGLIATQGIRGGANRIVLERIKQTGDIFLAYSDRDWILDGATVHVSIVGFDDGSAVPKFLDDRIVLTINSDLTSEVDLTETNRLDENQGLSFIGTQKTGPFDLTDSQALKMIGESTNPDERSNRDVIKPWINAIDVTRRPRNMWIIDFGTDMTLEEASKYVAPFQHVQKYVKPERDKVNRKNHRERWWLFGESRPGMRTAIASLQRFIATPLVSKYRVFAWISAGVIPENLLVVIAREDDYFWGVLQSQYHELWARRMGTQLREAESGTRYTPTTTFETFPFPWPPGQEPAEANDPRVFAIAAAARQLDQFRTAWLNPPAGDIGTVIPSHVVNNLTLTNLYNALTLFRTAFKGKLQDRIRWVKETKNIITLEQIDELDHIHNTLDRAVLDAYGWPHHLTDEQILERLLALNLERAA